MSGAPAAVTSELLAEICSITGADEDTAIALLQHNNNNLQLALDSFFRGPEDEEPVDLGPEDEVVVHQAGPDHNQEAGPQPIPGAASEGLLTLPELEQLVEGWKQEAANRAPRRQPPTTAHTYDVNDPKLGFFWDQIFKQFHLQQRLTVLSLVCSDWAQRVRFMPAEVAVSIPDGDSYTIRQLQHWLADYGYLVTSLRIKAEPHVWTSEELRTRYIGDGVGKPVLKLVCSDLIGLEELSIEGLVLQLDATGVNTGMGAAAAAAERAAAAPAPHLSSSSSAAPAAASEDGTATHPDDAWPIPDPGAAAAGTAAADDTATAATTAAAQGAEAAAVLLSLTSINSASCPSSGSSGVENSSHSDSSSSDAGGGSDGGSSDAGSSSSGGGSNNSSSCSLVSLDSVDSYGSSSIKSDAALAPLLPALRALCIRNCSIGLLSFEHLQCLHRLTNLDLIGLTITKHSVGRDALSDSETATAVSELLQQLPNLVSLSLGADINLDDAALVAVSDTQKLQRVSLSGANCGSREVAAVPSSIPGLLLRGYGQLVAPGALDLSRFEHLTSLELENVDIEPDVVTAWPELQQLVLDGVGIRLPRPAGRPTARLTTGHVRAFGSPEGDAFTTALRELQQLRHLRLVKIYSGPSTGQGGAPWQADALAGRLTLYIKPPLSLATQLTHLQFNVFHINDALRRCVQLPQLQRLHIGGLAHTQFLQIGQVLIHCSHLQEVVLSAARDDSKLTYIPPQHTLKLEGSEFTDRHAHALAAHVTGSNLGPSKTFSGLSEIEWSGSVELTDVGLMWLAALKGLQRLEVQGCGISHQVFGSRAWCDTSKSRLLLTGGDMLYQGSPAVWQQLWELCQGSRLCRNAIDKARRELQLA